MPKTGKRRTLGTLAQLQAEIDVMAIDDDQLSKSVLRGVKISHYLLQTRMDHYLGDWPQFETGTITPPLHVSRATRRRYEKTLEPYALSEDQVHLLHIAWYSSCALRKGARFDFDYYCIMRKEHLACHCEQYILQYGTFDIHRFCSVGQF